MEERCYILKSMNTSKGWKIRKSVGNRKRKKAFEKEGQ